MQISEFAVELGLRGSRSDRARKGVGSITVKDGIVFEGPRLKVDKIGGMTNLYDRFDTRDINTEVMLSRVEASGVVPIRKIINAEGELTLNHKEARRLSAYMIALFLRQPENIVNGQSDHLLQSVLGKQSNMTADFSTFLHDIFFAKKVVTADFIRVHRLTKPVPLPVYNAVVRSGNRLTTAIRDDLLLTVAFRVQNKIVTANHDVKFLVGGRDIRRQYIEDCFIEDTENLFVFNPKNLESAKRVIEKVVDARVEQAA